MKKFSKLIVFILLFVIFLISYLGVLSHVPYFHEQHHLFLFSSSYFINTVHSSGILDYITNFIIQFFYNPWLGSIILSLLLSSIYIFVAYSSSRISCAVDNIHLGVVLSIYFFLCTLTVEFSISVIVAFFLVLALISLSLSFNGTKKYIICTVLVIALLFIIPWKVIVVSIVTIALSALSGFLMRNVNNKFTVLLTIIVIIIYSGVGFYRFYYSYNIGERRMIQAQQYVKNKEWNKVLNITDKYLKSGRKNQLMSYYRSMALFHTGQLTNHLFDIPQIYGMKALYFPWQSNSREAEYGQTVYEELGCWNEAHRWLFEAMTVWGETAPILIDLTRCNIKMNRFAVSQHFINILSQSLFYSKNAEKLQEELLIYQSDKHISNSKGNHFFNIMNIEPELKYLCDSTPGNKMAVEYYLSSLLLSNQVVRFSQNIYRLNAFPNEEYSDTYEEALYLYKLGDNAGFDNLNIKLKKSTEERFNRYYKLYSELDMEQLEKEFGKTYWYYIHFVSPYGNKIINKENRFEELSGGGLKH